MLKGVNDLIVSHACIESLDLVSVHLYKTLLRLNVLVRFLIQEERFHQLKEAIRVESKEP